MKDYRNEAEANFGAHAQRKLTEEELDRLNAIFHPPVQVPAPRIPRRERWNWFAIAVYLGSALVAMFCIAGAVQIFNSLIGG